MNGECVILEKFSKNKRGRPQKYSDQFKTAICKIYPEMTWRSVQNNFYSAHPHVLLQKTNREKFTWLVGDETGRGARKTILSEMGRIYEITQDDGDLIRTAEWICENRPKTQEIVRVLRQVRREMVR